MRVLIFGMTENFGGVESIILNYTSNAEVGTQFDYISFDSEIAEQDSLLKVGANIYTMPRRRHLISYVKFIFTFMRKNAKRYDVFWSNQCDLVNIDLLVLAKIFGIKKRIIHCHNSQSMYGCFHNLLHRFNALFLPFFVTDFWTCSNNANKWFYGTRIMKKYKIQYIPNAIYCEKYIFNRKKRETLRKKYDLSGFIVLGNVGRLSDQKNQIFLLDVFSDLLKTDMYKIILIGDGEDRSMLENFARKNGLDKYILFLGNIKDVTDWYNVFDYFIFPSKFEGVSVALLEAQANGLPCIISSAISTEGVLNSNVRIYDLTDKDIWVDIIVNKKIRRIDNINNSLLSSSFNLSVSKNSLIKYFQGVNNV